MKVWRNAGQETRMFLRNLVLDGCGMCVEKIFEFFGVQLMFSWIYGLVETFQQLDSVIALAGVRNSSKLVAYWRSRKKRTTARCNLDCQKFLQFIYSLSSDRFGSSWDCSFWSSLVELLFELDHLWRGIACTFWTTETFLYIFDLDLSPFFILRIFNVHFNNNYFLMEDNSFRRCVWYLQFVFCEYNHCT